MRRRANWAGAHSVVAMVDVGDLREGMMPAEVPGVRRACGGACERRPARPGNESHVLRLDRAERSQPRAARPARRGGGASARAQARHLGRQLDLARAHGSGARARVSRQRAHRRGDRARRGPCDPRAHPRPAHRRADALCAGDRVQGEAVDTGRRDGSGRIRQPTLIRGPRRSPARHLCTRTARRTARAASRRSTSA